MDACGAVRQHWQMPWRPKLPPGLVIRARSQPVRRLPNLHAEFSYGLAMQLRRQAAELDADYAWHRRNKCCEQGLKEPEPTKRKAALREAERWELKAAKFKQEVQRLEHQISKLPKLGTIRDQKRWHR